MNGRRWPVGLSEIAILAATMVTAVGLAELVRGASNGPAVVPDLVMGFIGYVITAILLRTRLPRPVVPPVALAVVMAVDAWWSFLRNRGAGNPLPVILHGLRGTSTSLRGFHFPVHSSPGVLFLCSFLAGIAGVEGRALLGHSRDNRPLRPALALLPSFCFLAIVSAATGDRDKPVITAAYVVAATAALASGSERSLHPAGVAVALRRGVPAGVVAVLLVVVTVFLGSAIENFHLGGAGATSLGSFSTSQLVTSAGLVRVEESDPTAVAFRARSPISTYWQIATLSVWSRNAWIPDATTQAGIEGQSVGQVIYETHTSPGSLKGASVTMGVLRTHLLPVPLDTIRIHGHGALSSAVLSPVGVTSTAATSPGDKYSVVVNPVETTVGGAPNPARVPRGQHGIVTSADTTRPPVPSVVTALADELTFGAGTPSAKAQALVNWFQSGLFHYSLSPPASPKGSNSLVAFLMTTRSGSCESFATAFVVMARLLGLPARVAIGFTSGQVGEHGTTVVRDVDAHAWPEVYLSTHSGWASFEPTPALPVGERVPSDVIGPASSSTPSRLLPAPVPGSQVPQPSTPSSPSPLLPLPVTPTTAPAAPTGPLPKTSPTTLPSQNGSKPKPASVPHSHPKVTQPLSSGTTRTSSVRDIVDWAALLGIGAGLIVLCITISIALPLLRRSRRRRRSDPSAWLLYRASAKVDASLSSSGLARPSYRTLRDHARKLGAAEASRASNQPIEAGGDDHSHHFALACHALEHVGTAVAMELFTKAPNVGERRSRAGSPAPDLSAQGAMRAAGTAAREFRHLKHNRAGRTLLVAVAQQLVKDSGMATIRQASREVAPDQRRARPRTHDVEALDPVLD